MSDTPIIVPITAPGATEAASQVRTFAKTVAETSMAHEKLAQATVKSEVATKAEGQSVEGSTQKHQHHIRTLNEEIARLQVLEHQQKITNQARAALGESFNGQDIGKMRTFVRRSLGGGIMGELGRGTVEGIEGMQGGGMAGMLGMAGAGIAGLTVAIEGIKSVIERFKELQDFRNQVEEEGIQLSRDAQAKAGALGATGQSRYGSTFQQLAAFPGATDAATAFMQRTKDPTGAAAFLRARQMTHGGAGMGGFLQAAQDLATLKGISVEEAAKLIPQGAANGLNSGLDPMLIERSLMSSAGLPMRSGGSITAQLANIRGSKIFQDMQRNGQIDVNTALGQIVQIPAQQGPKMAELAATRNPGMQALIDKQVPNRLKDKSLSDSINGESWAGGWVDHALLGIPSTFYNYEAALGFGSYGKLNEQSEMLGKMAGIPEQKDFEAEELAQALEEAGKQIRAANAKYKRGAHPNVSAPKPRAPAGSP